MRLLEIKSITKVYKTGVVANKNLSLTLEKGKIVGIVGPNGSGKTTLIRQILNLLKPTEGEIVLYDEEGNSILDYDREKYIGYVSQYPIFFPSLTVEESLIYPLKMLGFKDDKIKEKLEYIYQKTPLIKYKDEYTYTLSGGNKKLLLLATALIQDKNILILDEPTSMVDILSQKVIWDLLLEIKDNVGIILSSHNMHEVQKLCDEVYILINGSFISHIEGRKNIADMSIINDFTIEFSNKEDINEIFSILNNEGVKYKNRDLEFNIFFKTERELIFLLAELFKFKINRLSIDFPSFEKGVINIVEGYSETDKNLIGN